MQRQKSSLLQVPGRGQEEDRDEQDMNREIAPLKQAEDAVLIDSSDMSIEQVVDAIIDVFEKTK